MQPFNIHTHTHVTRVISNHAPSFFFLFSRCVCVPPPDIYIYECQVPYCSYCTYMCLRATCDAFFFTFLLYAGARYLVLCLLHFFSLFLYLSVSLSLSFMRGCIHGKKRRWITKKKKNLPRAGSSKEMCVESTCVHYKYAHRESCEWDIIQD